ncbi:PorP/SprF family type IX secretion system membrane protein [Flavobacteriales bacterium AH-315-E23]|nr:PorP/SprF family type IX secretion system membrane protein [Flavobacteriales bacterium AH-315-E23]
MNMQMITDMTLRNSRLATLIMLMVTLSIELVIAQDSHISQFYASELTLNPALTGEFSGEHRGYLNYRAQWRSLIKTAPYETTILAYDRPLKRFGVGGYIMNNRAGSSGINFLNLVLSGSYEVSIDPQRVHHLTTGIQLGIINKRYVPTTFDAQYDTTYGDPWFNESLPTGEVYQNLNYFLPEVNFGVFYYNAKRYVTFNPYGGISGFHLTNPRETFYSTKNKLPLRIVGYGGTKIHIDKIYSVDANFLYMMQANDYEFQFGALLTYDIEGSDNNFFAGPYYRNKDAFIFHVGGTYDDYVIRFSYDINTSSLKSVSKGRGGFEVSITYVKQKARYLPSIF